MPARGLIPTGRSGMECPVTGNCTIGMTGNANCATICRILGMRVASGIYGGGGMMLGGSSPGCGQSTMATCG